MEDYVEVTLFAIREMTATWLVSVDTDNSAQQFFILVISLGKIKGRFT